MGVCVGACVHACVRVRVCVWLIRWDQLDPGTQLVPSQIWPDLIGSEQDLPRSGWIKWDPDLGSHADLARSRKVFSAKSSERERRERCSFSGRVAMRARVFRTVAFITAVAQPGPAAACSAQLEPPSSRNGPIFPVECRRNAPMGNILDASDHRGAC